MDNRHRLARIRRRGAHLPASVPVEPVAREALLQNERDALAPLVRTSAAVGLGLILLALGAPALTGDGRSWLLAGVPGALLLTAAALARRGRRQRLGMVAATSASGFLALASAPGLATLADWSQPPGPALLYQPACFLLTTVHLAIAYPCWRSFDRAARAARAVASLHEEL
jgi:hypothetical protein